MIYNPNAASFLYSFASGFSLIIFAFFCYFFSKRFIAPAVSYSLIWGGSLLFLSISPYFGFYPLNSYAVLMFFIGSLIFSFFSIVFEKVLDNVYIKVNLADELDFEKIFLFFLGVSLLCLPLITLDVLSYGKNIAQIAYNLRQATLRGVQVGNFFTANYFVLSYFLSILFVFAIVRGYIKPIKVILAYLPFLVLTLLITGRSALVSLILAWFFVYFFSGGKLSLKSSIIFFFSMLIILVFGATLVGKVNVNNSSFDESAYILLVHMLDYLFQGPVLFARYFDGDISIRESWDALNNACHALSKIFGVCEPILHEHADNAYFGDGKLGNVYSIYFSIFPYYSYFGVFLFTVTYSMVTTYFYVKARRGDVFSISASGFLYSAIILSIYKDGFGSSFWLLVKFYLISLMIIILFKKNKKECI